MIRTVIALMGILVASCAARAQDIPATRGLDAAAKAAVMELIEGAKKEGSLAYADTIIQPTTNDQLVKAFREYYGLPATYPITYTLLTSAAMITRLEQEMSADKIRVDVAAVGSPTWVFEKHAAGALMEYKSPEYRNYKGVVEAGLGVENYFLFNGGYAQIPIWNAEVLDFKGKSYKDALDAAVPQRFSIGNAVQSESHLTTYAGLRQVLGVDYFKALAAKKPTLISRSEQSAQRIIAGQDVIAFGGNPSRVLQANDKGAKLKILYPSEGFTFLPQSMFIPKGAQHPNAAKLWFDFILSQTGQELLARTEALISGRTGFKSPFPEVAPDFASLKIIKVDWKAMTADELKKYREEWTNIFNP